MISMLPRSRRLKVALSMNLNDLFPIMLTKHMVFVTLRDDKPSYIQSYLYHRTKLVQFQSCFVRFRTTVKLERTLD